jgi:paraquat-inducible protein B
MAEMNGIDKKSNMYDNVEEVIWEEKKRRLSTVWIVPIVALVVGAWLMFQSINEKGPEIKITFKSAEGIETDKTVIKYKNIVIGKVKDVTFGNNLKDVIVTAELKKNMQPYLSEKTRFWVVRARLGVGEVQGLDTLLSGAYIVIDPAKGKEKVRNFSGLEEIPVVDKSEKGETFILKANDIGSLSVGSPIYYKKLQAGSVASYSLDPDGKKISIKIFIKEPFNHLVKDVTRFWNASGISAGITANGVEIQTESLTSILLGGLSFDNFAIHGLGVDVKPNYVFNLYENIKKAKKIKYKRELYFWVYFKDSIRGLSIGAPVEFRGVKIGEVVSFSLEGDASTSEFRIPILIKIEPQRFTILGVKTEKKENSVDVDIFKGLLEKGFRAQLQSGNLLTGELFVDLNMHDNVTGGELRKENGFYVIPTVPATIETLKSDVKTVLDKIAAIPFKSIGDEVNSLVLDVRKNTLPTVNSTMNNLNRLVTDTNKMMNSANRNYFDNNAEVNKKLIKLLDELTKTSRSIKHLTDYLERHPESLIKGK